MRQFCQRPVLLSRNTVLINIVLGKSVTCHIFPTRKECEICQSHLYVQRQNYLLLYEELFCTYSGKPQLVHQRGQWTSRGCTQK